MPIHLFVPCSTAPPHVWSLFLHLKGDDELYSSEFFNKTRSLISRMRHNFFFLNKNTKKSSLLTDLLTSIQEQDWGVTSFIPVLWNKSSSECSMHVKYHREACLSMASCQGGLGETLSVIHLWSLNFHALNCSIL